LPFIATGLLYFSSLFLLGVNEVEVSSFSPTPVRQRTCRKGEKGKESIGKGIFYSLVRGSFAMTMAIPGKAKIAFPRVRVGNAPTRPVYMSNDPLVHLSKSNAGKEWERKIMRKPLFLGFLLASCLTREKESRFSLRCKTGTRRRKMLVSA